MNIGHLIAVVFLILAGCTTSQNTANTQKMVNTKTASLSGTYFANLPCKDCTGVMVDLVLESNQHYSMIAYPNNSQIEYADTGTWQTTNGQIILRSHNPDNKASLTSHIRRLAIQTNKQLTLLNNQGKTYQKDASRYIFEKK